jgi:hypothetical protein
MAAAENLPGYLQAVGKLADRHRLLLGTYGVVVSPSRPWS